MQMKTYFANSVPAALEVARKELGEDAMLVTSKPTPAASRAFGKLEVTFAYEPRQAAAPAKTAAPSRQQPSPAGTSTELDEIREQLTQLRNAMGRVGSAPAAPARNVVGPQELAARIPVMEFGGTARGQARNIAFIGPPGRGKTTTTVKVAARFGIAMGVPVRIFSAGAHGVGCQEQMARYAAILGVPFQAFESFDSLGLALSGEGWKGLSLIDTPGISPSDMLEISEMGRFFERHPEIEKHLVLRADASSADLSSVISRFAGLAPDRLLFTGLDEAVSAAAMIDTLVQSSIPGALLGTGARIPDDLEEVDALRLARLVCGETALAAVA